MNTPSDPIYVAPFILFLFFAMSAIAVVVAILRWTWLLRRDELGKLGVWTVILWGQINIFLGITVFSLSVALISFVYPFEDTTHVTIIPEILILSGAAYFFWRRSKRQNIGFGKTLSEQLRSVLFWVLSCILGWGISLGIGILIFYIVSFLARNNIDFVLVAIMITGLLWNLPTLTFFYYIRRNYAKTTGLMRHSFQTVLMPMALAYAILMVPLAIQEAANSPEFQKQKYEKPIRKA